MCFGPFPWTPFKNISLCNRCDQKLQQIELNVYTDILEYQIEGASYVLLLHNIRVQGQDNLITVIYDKPHYILVSKHYINSIIAEIKTDQR